jgi:hypothetical protein
MATGARILQLHLSIPVPVAMPYPLPIGATHGSSARYRYLVFKTSGDGLAVVSLSRCCLGLFQQTQGHPVCRSRQQKAVTLRTGWVVQIPVPLPKRHLLILRWLSESLNSDTNRVFVGINYFK